MDSRVSNGTDDVGKKKRVYLGTFPTAKGAAIAFDTTVLNFRAEEPLHGLNFSQYASAIQGILKGRSVENINSVARMVADYFVDDKDQEFEGSTLTPHASSGANSGMP